MPERAGQLDTAAADVWRTGQDLDGGIRRAELAGLDGLLPIDPDLARHDQCLRLFAGVHQPAVGEQSVESRFHNARPTTCAAQSGRPTRAGAPRDCRTATAPDGRARIPLPPSAAISRARRLLE